MKIKDAISILEAYKAVAGEDAECEVDHFSLRSFLSVEYYQSGYSFSDRQEKSRTISYTVQVVLPQPAAQYVPSDIELRHGLTG